MNSPIIIFFGPNFVVFFVFLGFERFRIHEILNYTNITSACARAVHEFYRPSTVKIPTPNIPGFVHITKHSWNDARNMLPLHKVLYAT